MKAIVQKLIAAHAVAVFALAIPGTIANADVSSKEDVVTALLSRIEDGRSVGYSVGVIGASGSYQVAIGNAKKADDVPITTDSLFEIGSITKTFTGLLLAEMISRGEVSLDDPVSKLLPKTVEVPSYEGVEITLRHLVTHTSGLPSLPDNFSPSDPSNPYAEYTVSELYDFLSNYQLTRAIGDTPEYSNLGMGLLGHALALHVDVAYEQLIRERILLPLGMTSTFINIPEAKRHELSDGHDPALEPVSHWDLPTLEGAGAIRSNISDMMTYLQANMGLVETPIDDAILLSHQFQHSFGSDTLAIGLAWIIEDSTTQAPQIIWHNGGTGGYRTFIGFRKAAQNGVVVLVNSQDNADSIGRSILNGDVTPLMAGDEASEFAFSASEIGELAGNYELAPNFHIEITHSNGHFYGQATDQPKFAIFARSKTEFFLKEVEASLTFVEGENGVISSLVLHQNGQDVPGIKIE